jgi:hypothetical protein
MGGFTRSVIFEPWAPRAYAAVEVNCSEHGNHNPGVGGSSPSLATKSDVVLRWSRDRSRDNLPADATPADVKKEAMPQLIVEFEI